MSISLVQKATSNTAASSIGLAYSSNVTKGNLLVVGFRFDDVTDTASVTDSQGNSYTSVAAIQYATMTATTCIFFAFASSTAANTVTASIGTSQSLAIDIREYLATAGWPLNPLDNTQNVVNAGSTGTVSAPITTKFGNEVLYSFTSLQSAASSWAAGSGWTNAQGTFGSGRGHQAEDYLNVAPGTYGTQGTLDAAHEWTCVVAAFYENSWVAALVDQQQAVMQAFPQIVFV